MPGFDQVRQVGQFNDWEVDVVFNAARPEVKYVRVKRLDSDHPDDVVHLLDASEATHFASLLLNSAWLINHPDFLKPRSGTFL